MGGGRARALRLARRAYVVLVVAVLVAAVVGSRDALSALLGQARLGLVVLSLLLAFGQVALTSTVWAVGLRALGSPVAWSTVLVATAAAAPSRYLPGSIWYAVSRGAFLRRRGLPVRSLAAVATLETALVPVVGFALGSALLAASGDASTPAASLPLLVGCLLLLGLATPPVVKRLLRLRAGDTAPPVLGWPGLLAVVAAVTVFWLWSAVVFAVYVAAFPGATSASALTVGAAYMLAWGVGWLAVFAPQGVGVFEVTLAALLVGGATELAVVVAGYRVVILLRDLLGAAAAAAAVRRSAALAPVPR